METEHCAKLDTSYGLKKSRVHMLNWLAVLQIQQKNNITVRIIIINICGIQML